jgi:Resolvase, N terminal domain
MSLTPSANPPVDLPAAFVQTGVLVGYGRVSTREQNLARQQAALTAAGCANCFFERPPARTPTDRS